MSNIDLSFPDQSYSTSVKPSTDTLKSDLTILEGGHNGHDSTINDHESRIDVVEAAVVDVRGLQEGLLINGKIVTSVSSDNLTVAIKTLAGSDPSADDPVYVRVDNTIRSFTSAKSVTLAAGTNWFSAGLAQQKEFAVYVIWNTTPATDRLDIGVSLITNGAVYSRFSSTSTAGNYLGYSGSDAPASTDVVRLAGHFQATLSTGAGYTWTIGASAIVVQFPISGPLQSFIGETLTIKGSKTVTQAQNLTVTFFTISNIANGDSGWIKIYVGGNLPADRCFTAAAWAWYKTGGTMNISAGATTFISINVTSPNIVGSVVGSSGDILVKVVTAGFGAGNFEGNVMVEAGSLSSGMTIV